MAWFEDPAKYEWQTVTITASSPLEFSEKFNAWLKTLDYYNGYESEVTPKRLENGDLTATIRFRKMPTTRA